MFASDSHCVQTQQIGDGGEIVPCASFILLRVLSLVPMSPSSFSGLDKFDPNGASAAADWEKWKRSLDLFIAAHGIRDGSRMRAVLLHEGGRTLQDIVDGLEQPGATYEGTIAALDTYFRPRLNVIYEINQFLCPEGR